jgi:hypothetical protein
MHEETMRGDEGPVRACREIDNVWCGRSWKRAVSQLTIQNWLGLANANVVNFGLCLLLSTSVPKTGNECSLCHITTIYNSRQFYEVKGSEISHF